MKPLMISSSLLILSLAVAAPAFAADDAAECRTLGKQVVDALSQSTGDVSEARHEKQKGADACSFGLWDNGAAHYRKALSLLGK